MRTTLKIAALSAALATILVTAVDLPKAGAAAPVGKAFTERLPEGSVGLRPALATGRVAPQGDALRERLDDPCAKAVWPYVPQGCLARDAAPARAARTITIEQRDTANTSALVRVPVRTVAAR